MTKKSMIALIPVPVLVALLLSTNLSGVGISYDTTEYFAGAKHLADSGAYSGVDGSPQATWPPGYSFLLSIPVRIGFSLESSSLITTGLSLAIIAIVVIVLLQRYSVSRTISVSALVVLFTLPPLIAASSVALSELPFIAAVLSSIVVVTWRRSRWIALAAGLLCGVAYMMRYVGLIFIPVVALCYPLRFARKAPARTLTLDVAVLLAAAAALPLWWTRRNFEVAGSATGNREPGGGSLVEAGRSALEALGQIVVGESRWATGGVALMVGLVTLGLTLLTGFIHLRRKKMDLALISLVPLGYITFTAYRFVKVEYAPIDLRAMTPLLPLVVLSIATIDRLGMRRRIPQFAVGAVAAVIALMGALDVGARSSEAQAWGSPRFQESPFAKIVSTLNHDVVIISNFPQRAFSLTKSIPIRNQYQFDLPVIDSCQSRFGLWFVEAPFQGNEPKLAEAIYQDGEGIIYDLGDCRTPPKTFWE